ncbi:hypothetical protein IG195_00450 [Arthrobacter sp. TES]|uniref:hypothetical protein n=1 Tax=Paenarthrobacter ureafaciens TaxID=37931 RepID=UPI00140A4A28|nr:hypothetical protein [Paenarthrobacter ureafaciens]MCX8454665.1 hypothetical protein [Paenarthrobacter ureafaciens]MCY0974158.1 hypothetical protein [Paenarthrobacter ureafaciens]QOI63634.1 hypothetical protein IG195_00450 [Arthrobacter sp. TES]
MEQQMNEVATSLMIQLNVAGESKFLTDSGNHPAWFAQAVSQILALTGDDPIVTAGHTLEGYDLASAGGHTDSSTFGRIQVLTENLLVVSDFAAPNDVKTTAIPLRDLTAVRITNVTAIGKTDGGHDWPTDIRFEIDVAGSTFIFPPGPEAAWHQQNELPAAFAAVRAALQRK